MGRYLCCRIFVHVAFFVFPTGADAPLKLEALHKNGKRKIKGSHEFSSRARARVQTELASNDDDPQFLIAKGDSNNSIAVILSRRPTAKD